jgi:GrpB-like predicted nucleotidyltransferase (UPF0157 family)
VTRVVVLPYDPAWPARFDALAERLSPALAGLDARVEHVGSTSVPGLAAKPIIDADVIVAAADVPAAITALATLGYAHRGDLGVPGRHAFTRPEGTFAHNLYVCVDGCESLVNHLTLRDHLRAHPDDAAAYGALKLELARRHPDDIDAYIEGKTPFIVDILSRHGMSGDALERITDVNRR